MNYTREGQEFLLALAFVSKARELTRPIEFNQLGRRGSLCTVTYLLEKGTKRNDFSQSLPMIEEGHHEA
ncbi:hypothetical protein QCA50_004836 [Cerrena zonata]|uniref:Uncharacterized protein n=1 Tax=Cerrena zonata TaxID=2478898 RepID=A0AAW0GNF0_9APHY